MKQKFDFFIHKTKHIYKNSENKVDEVKSYFIKLLPYWIAGSITAIMATLYAKLFSSAEELSLKIFEASGWWFLIVPPIFFSISWALVENLAPYANGSGIPQLMVAVEISSKKHSTFISQLLSFRIILVKIISSLSALLGGGSIGREGPTLQISGSIFHIINSKIDLIDEKARSSFLLAGAASGLASAFNTPLGGIVYVIEELAKSHLSSFRTGVLHAVIFAGLISQFVMGPYLYFGYPKISNVNYSQISYFFILALSSALIVTLFSQALKKIVVIRSKLKQHTSKLIFAMAVGFLFSLSCLLISKNTLGPGKTLLNELIFKNQTATLWDLIGRFLGTTLTYANGGAGGIFAPTLSLGGATSSYVESLLNSDLGPLAVLIGMTSGLAALTHSPLTSFILILEMTDRHSSIFPLMISAVIGHGVSKFISSKSFYEFVAERILINFERIEHENKN